MKKFWSVIAACVMMVASVISFAACRGGGVPANTVVVWFEGGTAETDYIDAIKKAYNAIDSEKQVKFIPMDSYKNILEEFSRGRFPDLVYVDDEYFKRYVDGGFLMALDDLLVDSTLDISTMWPQAVSRYRFNPKNNTSNETDPLWAIPKELDSTILYYNQGAFEQSGIAVISVPEDKIEEFNAGTYRDGHGKLKSEYPKLNNARKVAAKGYIRDFPYTHETGSSCSDWSAPDPNNETLIFNNRIPMSWDEIEDLAMYMTKTWRGGSLTAFGYYTEFWFNYGWSVGGDCIGDQNGNGEWVFTLNDNNPNYKVCKDVEINGAQYKASGENNFVFVSYKDKKWLASHTDRVNELVANGSIEQFPSTLEAFTRFTALSRDTSSQDPVGLNVAQKPAQAGATSDALGKFNLGELAMFVGFSDSLSSINESKVPSWDVAPLPVYKTYDSTGKVKQIGTRAGHGRGYAVGIISNTKKKDIAFNFLEYFVGEPGQTALAARHARVPNNEASAKNNWLRSGKNYEQVMLETQFQGPGDWRYMVNRDWIAIWSQKLNQNKPSVRNSTMTLSTFWSQVVDETNAALRKLRENR